MCVLKKYDYYEQITKIIRPIFLVQNLRKIRIKKNYKI